MNDDTNRQPLAPRPECAKIAPLLPLLRAQALAADDFAQARGHLRTCAWCHNQLAAFDVVDAGLRRVFSVAADAPPFLSVEAIMGETAMGETAMGETATSETATSEAELKSTPAPPSIPPRNVASRPDRPRGLLSGVGALAAVLLIAILAGTIFYLHGTPRGETRSPRPTPEPPLPQLNVYLAARSEVVALHATTGTTRWQAPIVAPTITSGIVAVNDAVVYSCGLLQGEVCPEGAKVGVHGLRGSDGKELWYNDLGGRIPGLWLLASGEAVYVAASSTGQSRLYALNSRDGSSRWSTDLPTGGVDSVPIIGDDLLYIQIGSAVYALRASDGRQLKRLDGEFPVAAGNGVLYTVAFPRGPSGQNYLSAWRTSDWSRLWRVQQDIVPEGLLADGVLYAGISDNKVAALDASTGAARWISEPGSTSGLGAYVDQAPILDHGTLYVHYRDSHVLALDPTTGKRRWVTQIAEDTAANGFVVTSGYVFTTGFIQSPRTANFVVALNATTGKGVWRYQAPVDLFAIAVGPVLTPGPIPPATSTPSVPTPTPSPSPSLAQLNVYLANAAEVAALHATTGKLRWHAPAASTTAAAVVAVNGIVAYSCRLPGCPDGGKSGVHGLRGSDGKELWYNDLGGDLPDLWPITTAGGTIFVAARTTDQHEQIIALNPADGSTRWAVEVPGDILYVPLVFGDDTLYLAIGNAVYMLRGADGQLLKQLEGEFPVAAGNGMLYTISMSFAVLGQGYVSAWHTSDWTRLWRVQHDVQSPVLLADGALYAGVAGDQFVAIDTTSGQTRWTRGIAPSLWAVS